MNERTAMSTPKTYLELGEIMLSTFGADACAKGYRIDASDVQEVGRQALLHGDINKDGTLN